MDKFEASKKAVDKIAPEIKEKLEAELSKLPRVQMKDGKVVCPGCSQELSIAEKGPGIEWVQVQGRCIMCHTTFVAQNKA